MGELLFEVGDADGLPGDEGFELIVGRFVWLELVRV